MAKKSRLAVLEDQAWSAAERISESLATKPLPVTLNALAAPRGIKRVRFERLWSTAGLVRCDDGFEVWINTEAPGAPVGEGRTLDVAELEDLEPPLRFTIAHEVVHLIFLELAEKLQKTNLLEQCADELETACSDIARALLIPSRRLFEEVGTRLFDASHLDVVRRQFRVSPQVFVLRLGLRDILRSVRSLDGLIVFAIEMEEQFRIKAHRTFGPQASSRFSLSVNSAQMRMFSDGNVLPRRHSGVNDKERALEQALGIPGIETTIRANDRYDVAMWVPGEGGMSLPTRLSVQRVADRPLAVLLAIEVTGPPERERKTV